MFDLGFRKAALHVYNYFGSLRKTSRVINVSIASLSRWLQRIDPLKRLTAPKTATDALVQLVKDLMTSRRCIYCTDVVKHLCSLGIHVSRQLVYTIVTKRLCLSFKRSRTRGFNPSSNVHFDMRNFIATFTKAFKERSLVSIDETGFDQRVSPVYSYAPRSTPSILHWNTCTDRSRTSVVMAISQDGRTPFVYKSLKGSFNGNRFAEFLQCLPFPRGSTILVDNARIHHTREVKDVARQNGYTLLFTPAYSPEFNPIELVFGVMKQCFYRLRYTMDNFVLDDAIQQCIDTKVDTSMITRCFEHVFFKFVTPLVERSGL